MAQVLKKAGSLLTQVYLRDTANFSSRGVFIRGLLVYTKAQVERKDNDARQAGKNVNSQEKNEKKTKEEAFSASMVARVRRSPTPPDPSDGGGARIH